jgi:isopentenyl phosphate kinase
MKNLELLKLGGSLITDKMKPQTARYDAISRLAEEISVALKERPDLKLILGHGSGSFGHFAAHKYGTLHGVKSKDEWIGFAEVWREASKLNRIISDAMIEKKIPVIVFSPLSSVISKDGIIQEWELFPIQRALEAGLIPLVYGDVVFDINRGGTILSTEDLFNHIIKKFQPNRVLLAGLEKGIWRDFPNCKDFINELSPQKFKEMAKDIHGSSSIDVTGGMISKVSQSIEWVQEFPEMEVQIFSGAEAGNLVRVLKGEYIGTRILI